MSTLLGVFREPEFSPGRVDDDAAILERTRDALAVRGWTMRLGGHDLLATETPAAVLAMCQSETALAMLDQAATRVPVINTPAAIRGCYRHETIQRVTGTTVPFPPTRIVSTVDDAESSHDVAPCWVKRGDVHAMTTDDVVYAATATDVRTVLADFAARGIGRAALQAHVAGVVVKFYGIADGRFFRCYTPGADVPTPIPALWEAAHAGARALGLEVFGGDLVVTAEGDPFLVDINDWPSFARCRDEAADAIAGYVIDRLTASVAAPQHQGHHE